VTLSATHASRRKATCRAARQAHRSARHCEGYARTVSASGQSYSLQGTTRNRPNGGRSTMAALERAATAFFLCEFHAWFSFGQSRSPHERSDMRDRPPDFAVAHPGYGCLNKQDVDGNGRRACPTSALLSAANRVNPTCGNEPDHDAEWVARLISPLVPAQAGTQGQQFSAVPCAPAFPLARE
jgi:hypothetical protein